MMTKHFLLAACLLTLAIATGCAKGGSGPCVANCASIVVNNTSNGIDNVDQAPVGGTIAFTATFEHATTAAVTWSITPSSCGSACGSITSTGADTATYTAPATVPASPNSPAITITATSQSDSGLSGTALVTIVDITAAVAPAAPNVGTGLTQQYTAVASPDNAAQTFTWTCTAGGATACANFTQDSKISGLAYYTAADSCSGSCIKISAASAADPNGCTAGTCTAAKATLVPSRLPTGTYAFKFSGSDSSGNAVMAAGTFSATSGTVNGGGIEDEITSSGFVQHAITGGSYKATTTDTNNSNNAGTLTLTTGASPNKYQVVLDSAGNIQMIESDGNGTGSGVAVKVASAAVFGSGDQTYAFGFTGVDSGNMRVGYAGLMPINGSGSISNGLMDTNNNANTGNICGASPCSAAGSYSYSVSTNLGSSTLAPAVPCNGQSAFCLHFDFFVANGTANAGNPLTLFAISTDPVDATHPAVLGTMVLQDSSKTYDNKAFSGISVSALTGAGGNVSLTLGATDGSSSGTGGTGNFTGLFDQNNAGTILTVSAFPSASQSTNPYTYVATNNSTGRYIFYMLGNPNAGTPVAPIPFVLYASGANRGFLLDQSSNAVLTGTMTPQQIKQNGGFLVPATMTGTYAVATNSNSVANAASCSLLTSCDATMNLLLTSPGSSVFNVTGTLNPGGQPVSGTYDVNSTTTVGSIKPPTGAKTPNFVFYPVGATDFYMIEEDSGVPSPILYMAQ